MRIRTLGVALLTLAVAAAGCDTGSRDTATGSTAGGSTGGGGTPPPPPPPSGTLLDVVDQPLLAGQAAQRPSAGSIVGLRLTLEALGARSRLIRLDVASAGTVDETLLGGLDLIEDLNNNGLVDQGETSVASAPSASVDNGTYVIMPISPLVFELGTPRNFLLALDSSAMSADDQVRSVGKTVALSVASAASVVGQDDQNNIVPGGGSYPIGGTTTLEVNDTAMISEVVVTPTAAEYVEIFNATGASIDLSDYYLTDFTDDPNSGRFYWKLPTGENFQNTTADWIVRFPAGTQLASGQTIAVAMDGAGYQTAYGVEAGFCLKNPSANSTQMLTWDGVTPGTNFVSAPGVGGLTNGGESVFLFTWDGVADLIVDVDLLNYGNSTLTNSNVDKSPGQAVGPDVKVDSITDADALESTFNVEAGEFFQFDNRAPGGSSAYPAIQRIDFTEGTEVKTGGNGLTGNDETSEEFGDGAGNPGTFDHVAAASPGQPIP